MPVREPLPHFPLQAAPGPARRHLELPQIPRRADPQNHATDVLLPAENLPVEKSPIGEPREARARPPERGQETARARDAAGEFRALGARVGARGAGTAAAAGCAVERDEGVYGGEERGDGEEAVERGYEPAGTGCREGEF